MGNSRGSSHRRGPVCAHDARSEADATPAVARPWGRARRTSCLGTTSGPQRASVTVIVRFAQPDANETSALRSARFTFSRQRCFTATHSRT